MPSMTPDSPLPELRDLHLGRDPLQEAEHKTYAEVHDDLTDLKAAVDWVATKESRFPSPMGDDPTPMHVRLLRAYRQRHTQEIPMSKQVNEGYVRDFRSALRDHSTTQTVAETIRDDCSDYEICLHFSPSELQRLTERLTQMEWGSY